MNATDPKLLTQFHQLVMAACNIGVGRKEFAWFAPSVITGLRPEMDDVRYRAAVAEVATVIIQFGVHGRWTPQHLADDLRETARKIIPNVDEIADADKAGDYELEADLTDIAVEELRAQVAAAQGGAA